jgi:hypothetical protein
MSRFSQPTLPLGLEALIHGREYEHAGEKYSGKDGEIEHIA